MGLPFHRYHADADNGWRSLEAARRGPDTLCLGDTIGTTTPRRVLEPLAAVREVTGGLDVGVHFHNTRGTGIASALAALQAGVTSLDTWVGGLGGYPFAPGASGNIATEELVYLLDGCGIAVESILTPLSQPPQSPSGQLRMTCRVPSTAQGAATPPGHSQIGRLTPELVNV